MSERTKSLTVEEAREALKFAAINTAEVETLAKVTQLWVDAANPDYEAAWRYYFKGELPPQGKAYLAGTIRVQAYPPEGGTAGGREAISDVMSPWAGADGIGTQLPTGEYLIIGIEDTDG